VAAAIIDIYTFRPTDVGLCPWMSYLVAPTITLSPAATAGQRYVFPKTTSFFVTSITFIPPPQLFVYPRQYEFHDYIIHTHFRIVPTVFFFFPR
jgi:hypothetical protein